MSDIVATYSEETDDLEQLLSEIDGGYKVTFTRKDPPWAEGQLGTIEFSPKDTISVDWIRNRFGGGLFSLKIKQPNGKYITHRTITISERPKNRQGMEIWPGPDGVPLTKEEKDIRPEPTSSPQNDVMIATLKEIMMAQSEQAKMTQDLLLKRVASLEEALVEKANTPQPAAPVLPPHYDPNQQLKTTLETMKMIEELKQSVSQADTDTDENPFLTKMMDKMIEKLTEEKPTAQTQAGPPPLPQRNEPSDLELAQMVKDRLRTMDPQTKEYLLGEVFDEDDEDEDETFVTSENDPRQKLDSNLDSLLSEEDQLTLNEANEAADHEIIAQQNDSP